MKKLSKFIVIIPIAIILLLFTKDGLRMPEPENELRLNSESVISSKESKAPITVDIFFDPACPPCAYLGDIIDDTLESYLNEGVIEVVYHPTAFLNNENNYSKLISASILSVANVAPNKTYNYIRSVITVPFQEKHRSSDDVLSIIENHLLKFGFNANEKDRIMEGIDEAAIQVDTLTKEFIDEDSKWAEFSPEGSVFAPYVLINKTGEHENQVFMPSSFETLNEELISEINKLK